MAATVHGIVTLSVKRGFYSHHEFATLLETSLDLLLKKRI